MKSFSKLESEKYWSIKLERGLREGMKVGVNGSKCNKQDSAQEHSSHLYEFSCCVKLKQRENSFSKRGLRAQVHCPKRTSLVFSE